QFAMIALDAWPISFHSASDIPLINSILSAISPTRKGSKIQPFSLSRTRSTAHPQFWETSTGSPEAIASLTTKPHWSVVLGKIRQRACEKYAGKDSYATDPFIPAPPPNPSSLICSTRQRSTPPLPRRISLRVPPLFTQDPNADISRGKFFFGIKRLTQRDGLSEKGTVSSL